MLLRSFYLLAPGLSRGKPPGPRPLAAAPYLLHITLSTRLTVVMEPGRPLLYLSLIKRWWRGVLLFAPTGGVEGKW